MQLTKQVYAYKLLYMCVNTIDIYIFTCHETDIFFAEPRSNVVGIGRGRITWRYTPERLGMANVTEHPANQGIINGITPNGDAQEEDLIARKLTEMQVSYFRFACGCVCMSVSVQDSCVCIS